MIAYRPPCLPALASAMHLMPVVHWLMAGMVAVAVVVGMLQLFVDLLKTLCPYLGLSYKPDTYTQHLAMKL